MDPEGPLKQEADRTVDANAVIAVESESTSEMKNKIASSAAGKTLGDAATGRCLTHTIIYNYVRSVAASCINTVALAVQPGSC